MGSFQLILSFSLEALEKILYRENSIIAAEDVPILLDVLCTASCQFTPIRIVDQIRANKEGHD